MFTGPQAQNGFTLTINKMKLDAVFLVVLGLTTLNGFLPKGLTSDWLYITRVTGVSSNSLKLSWPQSFNTVSSVMMVTVDPQSNWNIYWFPLTSRVANTLFVTTGG